MYDLSIRLDSEILRLKKLGIEFNDSFIKQIKEYITMLSKLDNKIFTIGLDLTSRKTAFFVVIRDSYEFHIEILSMPNDDLYVICTTYKDKDNSNFSIEFFLNHLKNYR